MTKYKVLPDWFVNWEYNRKDNFINRLFTSIFIFCIPYTYNKPTTKNWFIEYKD